MIVRFTASNVVAMIFFIPLLLAVGLILAFIVPLLAVIVAAAGILFAAVYVLVRIRLLKKQLARQSQELAGQKGKRGKTLSKVPLDVRNHKIRQ